MVTDMTREMLIESSQFNWFDRIEKSERLGITGEVMTSQLEVAMSEASGLGLDGHQLQLLQSKQAFHMAESDAYEDGRIARSVNREIVTNSESDNPEDYVRLQDPLSDEGKLLVKKMKSNKSETNQKNESQSHCRGKVFLTKGLQVR